MMTYTWDHQVYHNINLDLVKEIGFLGILVVSTERLKHHHVFMARDILLKG